MLTKDRNCVHKGKYGNSLNQQFGFRGGAKPFCFFTVANGQVSFECQGNNSINTICIGKFPDCISYRIEKEVEMGSYFSK